MEIKKGGKEAYKDIIKIGNKVFSKEFGEYFLKREDSIDYDFISLAKDKGVTIGYAIGYPRQLDEQDAYYIWLLAVLPKYKRKGIGRRLIAHNTKNHERIWLRIYPDSKEMISLAEKLGFSLHKTEDADFGTSLVYLLEQQNLDKV